jgi:hypothetical protein
MFTAHPDNGELVVLDYTAAAVVSFVKTPLGPAVNPNTCTTLTPAIKVSKENNKISEALVRLPPQALRYLHIYRA